MDVDAAEDPKSDLNTAPHKRLRTGDAVECDSRVAPAESAVSGNGRAACLKAREKILAVERDYTRYYVLDVGGESGADQFVYKHFNSLYVIGIAPSHAAISDGKQVAKVDFDVGRSGDKLANKPTGKKKTGAMFVKEDTRLCDIVCTDGTRIKVRPAVSGHLLEMNERLAQNPSLLNTKAASEGYIAILQPKRDADLSSFKGLLTHEQYMAAKRQ